MSLQSKYNERVKARQEATSKRKKKGSNDFTIVGGKHISSEIKNWLYDKPTLKIKKVDTN